METPTYEPVPGGVGPGPSLLGPLVFAAFLYEPTCDSPLLPPSSSSSWGFCLREVSQTGGWAAAQPELAVETPRNPKDRWGRDNNKHKVLQSDGWCHTETSKEKQLGAKRPCDFSFLILLTALASIDGWLVFISHLLVFTQAHVLYCLVKKQRRDKREQSGGGRGGSSKGGVGGEKKERGDNWEES